ncbi:hypothetical protein QQS21_004340 [Conoideocrella luteorostrata]|uniref:Cytochrome P450 monooxygenase n=1 Tax=Conoideocrella luteorostrata TaxID=1105319 RepID=A0AAJ0CSI6_9HYPO|nr:hypothetical protein QQS21_004340 [Conoideocrella luteorostrata]
MAIPSVAASVDSIAEVTWLQQFQPSRLLPFVVLALLALYFRSTPPDHRLDCPLLNPPKWYELKFVKQVQFLFHGIDELAKARCLSKGNPFRLLTNSREIVVLPPSYAEVLNTEDRLSFATYFAEEFNGDGKTAGLEPYSLIGDPCKRVHKLIKKRLTRSLNTIPVKMSSEASFAIEYNFGGRLNWQEVAIHQSVLDVVARMISRLFWDGDEVCRNEHWLKVMKNWSGNSVIAAFMINMSPTVVRPFVRRFSKRVHQARQDYTAARAFIEPLIEARRAAREKARAAGEAPPVFNDIVDWIDSENEELGCDPVALQMVLTVAAVHTTASLVTNTIVFLASDQSTLAPLRQELVTELRKDGCQAGALNNLKLMDSAIKECLRLKPPGIFGMHRAALQDMQLANGLNIYKGDRVFVDIPHMRDPNLYDSPDTYDIYRFLRMRSNPEQAIKAPLVNTSPEHLAFGHGAQACPGRFFAAVLSKVVLSHLLLKYDWQLAPDGGPELFAFGLTERINPNHKIQFRRRQGEFELN